MGRGRILGGAAAVVVVVVIALVVVPLTGGSGYSVEARFVSASQIVKGNQVKVSGEPIGKVQDVTLGADGRAAITLSIDEDGYFPLRRGTRAIICQSSLSGVANRYVDLQLGGANGDDIPDGGRQLADFMAVPPSALGGIRSTVPGSKSNGHVLPQMVIAGEQTLPALSRTPDNRGNSYPRPDARPDSFSQALPSFDCARTGEKAPNSTPGCKVSEPIPFGGVTKRYPNVGEAGPGGVLP